MVEEEIKLEEVRLKNDIRLQEAKIEKALANILEEETRLSYATVTAPIDGVVAFVSTQEGETVVASMSAPTFVTLIDLKKLEVTAFVDETDIGKIKERQKAKFTVDAFPKKYMYLRQSHIRSSLNSALAAKIYYNSDVNNNLQITINTVSYVYVKTTTLSTLTSSYQQVS